MRTPATDAINPARYEHAAILGRFARELDRAAIPDDIWNYAITIIVDTIGCAIGGTLAAPARPVVDVVRALAGQAQATVLGTDIVTDCVSAAYANAYLADILDFEDTLVSHPSVAAVPAALAVAERVGAAGVDLVRAVVAAYEVGVRVQEAVMPSFARRQVAQIEWGWKAFPAVVASGVLLELDERAWVDALGYAGAGSPMPTFRTLHDRPVSWTKANFDLQTRTGVLAALLAQAGFRAWQPILEDTGEFARMLGSDEWRPDALIKGLGRRWTLGETSLKPYPCCRLIHPVLDALADLRRARRIHPDDVAAVTIGTFKSLVDRFADYRPAELIDAEFSVPYVVAMMLLDRPPGPDWHQAENLRDPVVHALADRVRMTENPEFTMSHVAERRYGATVTVTLRDGSHVTARRDQPRGGREDPLSADELRGKFIRLTEPVLGDQAADRCYDALRDIDAVPDIREITPLLRTARTHHAEDDHGR